MSDLQRLRSTDLIIDSELGATASLGSTIPPKSGGLTTRVVSGSVWSLAGQGGTILATLVATPFVIRLLGSEQFGLLALINVLIAHLTFADMGMGWASTRFGSEAYARGDEQGEATVIWTALLLAAVSSLLIALLLFVGTRLLVVQVLRLPPHLHETAVIALRFATLGFVARVLASVLNTPELVRIRMDLVVLINIGTLITQILLIPIVLALGGGLFGAVVVIAACALLAASLHAMVGMRLLPQLRRPKVSVRLLRPLSRFGGAIVISSLAAVVLSNVDKVLLTRYSSVQALAYYSVAFNLAMILAQAPAAMVQSLLPALSRLQANTDRSALQQLYRRALQGTWFWVAPASVFICAVARPFFTLWAGPEFGQKSTIPLYLLTGGLIFEAMAHPPYTLLMALGRSDVVARCHVALLVPYLIGSGVLIHFYGAAGAALGWSLRAIVGTSAFTVAAWRISGFGLSPLPENLRDYLATITVLLIPPFLAAFFLSSAWQRLAVVVASVVAYSVLILMRVLTRDERNGLLSLLPLGLWRAKG